jgi:hypothetical protein
MSDRGTPTAKSESKPKWPALHMYTGVGKDRDPQRINAWFQLVTNYINNYGIKKTDPDAPQDYGVYSSNSIVDQFEIFSTDITEERKTIPELKKCFETYFLA